MLKHATINRTSRAQQTLQLQRQLNLQQSLSPPQQVPSDLIGKQQFPLEDTTTHQNHPGYDDAQQLINQPPSLTNYNRVPSRQLLVASDSINVGDDDNDTCDAAAHGGDGHVGQETTLPRSQSSSPLGSIPASPSSPVNWSPHKAAHSQRTLLTPAANNNNTGLVMMGSPSSPPINPALAALRPKCAASAGAESTIKVFAQTLSQDVEYITLNVNSQTKSNQIIKSLLRKFRLKHRDPNLFYLTLERWIRKDGLKFKSVMLLGDEACPLQLQQCCSNPPHNDIKFTLQSRTGALVKIFCSDVVPDARYKCLSLSTQTTVEETIELMLHCLNLATPQPTATTTTTNTDSTTSNTTRDGNHTLTTTTTTTITTTNLQCNNDHLHHQRHSNSPSSTSSSTSCDSSSSSSSSGIESEPTNEVSRSSRNNHDSVIKAKNEKQHPLLLPTTISNLSGLDVVDSAGSHHHHNQSNYNNRITPSPMLLDSHSRTSSVTSISSTSNVSNISASITDQYCMVIECKDTNYKRALDPDEYLVDIYHNLLAEAKDVVTSNNLNMDEPAKQQPEQWFHIKLKRRDQCNHNTIKFTSPRHNSPIPTIPFSLAQQFNNNNDANVNNLQQFVSVAQIEVNRSPTTNRNVSSSNLANSKLANCCEDESLLLCNPNGNLPPSNQTQARTQPQPQPQPQPPTTRARAPPPPEFISLPPVRPRRRNLSNASSTFGRPLTANRRRYDPAQLEEDLNKLNVKEVAVVVAAAESGGCCADQ